MSELMVGSTARAIDTMARSSREPAISVKGLTKSYGGRRVVNGLDFSVEDGEVFALLGPNGAGKTTTVEILEGYRSPDAGTVRVLGLDPQRQAAQLRPRVGVMLQESGLYRQIGVREALQLFASYYADPADPDALLDLVGLTPVAEKQFRHLSGGQKRRLALALALVGRPELVFLDEPTVGLDPQARRATWALIERLREEGVTVVLTTHYLEEAERLADRVAIIDGGRLLAAGPPGEIARDETSQVHLRAQPGLNTRQLAALPGALAAREEQPGRYVLETHAPAELLVELAAWLRAAGVVPTEIRVGPASLEEVFLKLIEQGPEP